MIGQAPSPQPIHRHSLINEPHRTSGLGYLSLNESALHRLEPLLGDGSSDAHIKMRGAPSAINAALSWMTYRAVRESDDVIVVRLSLTGGARVAEQHVSVTVVGSIEETIREQAGVLN